MSRPFLRDIEPDWNDGRNDERATYLRSGRTVERKTGGTLPSSPPPRVIYGGECDCLQVEVVFARKTIRKRTISLLRDGEAIPRSPCVLGGDGVL